MCIRDRALSKCKKELDKDEKNRVKNDLASLRRCLRKDKPEKKMCIRDRSRSITSCSATTAATAAASGRSCWPTCRLRSVTANGS